VNGNISTCPHDMANFSPLTAEICWRVWGTPENFNGFRVMALLLQRRHSLEGNQTLHECTTFGCVLHCYTVYAFEGVGLLPLTEFCQLQNSLCVQVLHSPILSALLHATRAEGIAKIYGVLQRMELSLLRGRHNSAGRTSSWTSAHILV